MEKFELEVLVAAQLAGGVAASRQNSVVPDTVTMFAAVLAELRKSGALTPPAP